jgi:uncharacterized cofD-like protein
MIQPAAISGAERRARLRRWLQPGLLVKRWVIVYFAALTLVSLGLGLVMTHLYRTQPFPGPVYYITLQFIPRLERGLLFLIVGGALMVWATLRITSSFVGLMVPHYRGRLGDALYSQRILSRGPKVVAIGGGTGLSSLLRGLKEYTSNITAVITVCDDGGSSGRLRRDLRVLPPGDFRQCIAALADSDPLVTKLFEHRFQTNGSDLKGHAFGNLFIAAMAQITGSFEKALEESSRVLAVRGRILPSTLEDVMLCAELADSSMVQGESLIPERAGGAAVHGHDGEPSDCDVPDDANRLNPIRRVFLAPERPAVYPEAVRAILDADLIVIGPGSLFTSILPNLLVDDLARALCWSRAKKIYVCNVATQPGETDHYGVVDHVRVIYEHLRDRLGISIGRRDSLEAASIPFTHVLVNNNLEPNIPDEWGVTRPSADEAALAEFGVELIQMDVVDVNRPTRHDSIKLANALIEVVVPSRSLARPAPLTVMKAVAASLLG